MEFSVAGIGSRFLAIALDTAIQTAAGIAILLIFTFVPALSSMVGREAGVWGVALMIALLFALMYGYFAVFEVLWNGQTPGKRAAGIRVIKESGRPLSAAESIGRNLLRIIDQLPGFYAIGIVTAMLNSHNKRLGDFVAGSIVVRESSLAAMRPSWDAGTPQASPMGAASLTIEEIGLVDRFLQRRYDLNPDVRSRMANQVLDRIRPKLSLDNCRDQTAESILAAVAAEYRSNARYA